MKITAKEIYKISTELQKAKADTSDLLECLAGLCRMFEDCLAAQYTTVENAATYSKKREGSTLKLFFEWSNGREDWRNNFRFPAKPYRDMRDKWLCHVGFLSVWKAIEPYIKDDISDTSVKTIYIVGYSHGAAVAQLCHEYVKFNRPDVEVCGVGFGAPRVFWGFARKAVKERFKDFLVVRNGRDLVTHLPPVFFGYRHICEVMNIGESKGLIKDHKPDAYLGSLSLTSQQEDAEK